MGPCSYKGYIPDWALCMYYIGTWTHWVPQQHHKAVAGTLAGGRVTNDLRAGVRCLSNLSQLPRQVNFAAPAYSSTVAHKITEAKPQVPKRTHTPIFTPLSAGPAPHTCSVSLACFTQWLAEKVAHLPPESVPSVSTPCETRGSCILHVA